MMICFWRCKRLQLMTQKLPSKILNKTMACITLHNFACINWFFEDIWLLNLLLNLENQSFGFYLIEVLRGYSLSLQGFCLRFTSAWENFRYKLIVQIPFSNYFKGLILSENRLLSRTEHYLSPTFQGLGDLLL